MPHITNTTTTATTTTTNMAPLHLPPPLLTANRDENAEGDETSNVSTNDNVITTNSTVSSGSGTPQTNGITQKSDSTSLKSKIQSTNKDMNGGTDQGQLKNNTESRSVLTKLQTRRRFTTTKQEVNGEAGDAEKNIKTTRTVITKTLSSSKIAKPNTNGSSSTDGSSTSVKKAPLKLSSSSTLNTTSNTQNTTTSTSSKGLMHTKPPDSLTNAIQKINHTKSTTLTNTIHTKGSTGARDEAHIITTTRAATQTQTKTIIQPSPPTGNVEEKKHSSTTSTATSTNAASAAHPSNTQNVRGEKNQSSSDSKFLDRVLEAMRSSKSQKPTSGPLNSNTFVLTSKSSTTTSSAIKGSGSVNGGALSPPPSASSASPVSASPSPQPSPSTATNGAHPNPLTNGGGSNSSLSSNTSVSTTASSRPPIPPKSLAKQRERTPSSVLSDAANRNARTASSILANAAATADRTRRLLQQSYDCEDGLLLAPSMKTSSSSSSSYQYRSSPLKSSTKSSTSTHLSSTTTSGLRNGYDGSNGISSSLSSSAASLSASSSLSSRINDFLSRSGSSGNSIRSASLTRRSPSPASSTTSSRRSLHSTSRLSATPPRRVFPQTYTRGDQLDASEMRELEQSPVVFDANLSFVLGCQKQPVHQTLRPSPSFEEPHTTSSYLSEKIQNFLRRTDHVQEEWTAMGKQRSRRTASVGPAVGGGGSVAGSLDSGRTTPTNSVYDDYDTISLIERQRERNSMERCSSVGRTRSSQNILTKAFQLTKTLPHTPTSRSNSVARELSADIVDEDDDDDRTIKEEADNDANELSEMAVDLAEERSTANIATERLEAETAERLKLEKELGEQQSKVKNLQETSEKLEMELICAKSDLNGISEDEDPENEEGGSGVFKMKYERAARELEFTKRRLQTQHEHDLEQLVGLKKQLEKKLSDAYEEVEEQRQVVGQWKRKAQKMTNEMNDLRMLLEEQNGRNNILEKKQRKFDSECQSLQDAARQERQTKDRLSREKDVLIAEKFTLEQTLADTRLELELKEEKLASLQRELEEMTFGGSTEEEIAQLRRSKNELDRRVKEQEEELDEMAGQVQLLEQAKLRLEMTLETMRKEARREAQQRDDELEEARNSAYKKIKALECQLETEHEERTLLLREKHELERRLSSMEDQDRMDRQAEEAATQKLKRDLRKYKALLKDAQAQLERSKAETPGKALIRQLRNQLEDAESARTLAMKARQAAEAELAELQAMFEESQKGRNDAEERANSAHRDRAELQAQIEENEEELAELMKKYSAAVKQLNTEQIAASEYEFKLSELEAERNNLKEQVSELQQRLENVENMADPSTAMLSKRLELRTKELESRLDLEQTTRTRLEAQVTRLKESLEKVQNDVAQAKAREMQAQDALKKSQKSLRDMREEYHVVAGREQESVTKRKDLEKKLEQVESESLALKNDLRLALQRIADLQQAMEEGDDDVSDSEDSHSTDGTLSDLEERLRPIKVKRTTTTNGEAMSPSTTKTLVREKDDNSPRITLTSPSSPHIHKLARQALKEEAENEVVNNEEKKSENAAAAAAATPTTANSINTEKSNESLKNGDVTSYA